MLLTGCGRRPCRKFAAVAAFSAAMPWSRKKLLLALAAAAALLPVAPAAATHPAPAFPLGARSLEQPLTGTGENMELVANLDIGSAEEIELAGDYAYVTGPEGLHIIDISLPTAPRQVSSICPGGFGDVGLNPDATIAIIATDGGGVDCEPEGAPDGGVAVIDVSDKAAPKVLSYILADRGAHTATLWREYVIVNQYDPEYRKAEIWSISDPAAPKLVGTWNVNGTAFHDSFVDVRESGRTLLYGASITAADVIDFTDPTKPVSLQRIYDPEVGIQHELQPNHSGDVLIVTDEFGGGAAGPGCGKSPTADATYMVPVVGAPQDLGAMHFYRAAQDGTFSLEGIDKLSTFNVPLQQNSDNFNGCTAHVFWQAPDENKLTVAWYGRGVRVVDFTDPSAPTEIGYFVADNANTWSAKPHNGFVFASDLNRGLDVYRFTGTGWPGTAGAAEDQRRAQWGLAPGAPADPGPAPSGERQTGTFAFKARSAKRVKGQRGRRVRLRFTVQDAFNRTVARASVRRRAGRRARIRVRGAAEIGGYRWYLRQGRRRVGAGGFQVAPSQGADVPARKRMVVRVS